MKMPRVLSVIFKDLERRFRSNMDFERHLNPKHALFFLCFVTLGIIALRFYHLSVTGYMLPDEFYYYYVIVLYHQPVWGRELFTAIYSLFFAGARTFSTFILAGVIYTSTWGIGTALLFYEIGRNLRIRSAQHSLMLLSLVFLPVYLVMLPMMVTESMGLFFALLGILFAVRFHRNGRAVEALLSSLSLVAAYKVREPYLLFALANFLGIILSHKRSWRSAIASFIPLLAFPMPISLWPPSFAEWTPVYSYLFQWTVALLLPHVTTIVTTGVTTSVTTGVTTGVTTSVTTSVTRSVTAIIPPTIVTNVLVRTISGQVSPLSYIYALAVGLGFGYNPIFAVLALVSISLAITTAWRKRSALASLAPWFGLTGLGAFAATVLLLVYPSSGLIPAWTSTVLRASHVSLPTVFTFPSAYKRMGTKRAIGVLLVVLVASSALLPVLSQAVESNLNLWNPNAGQASELSFSYRAPYYRLYQSAKNSGRTIVFAPDLTYATFYLSMLPNVQTSGVPGNETQFKAMIGGMDTIFLYAENTCSIASPSCLAGYPPYYRAILTSRNFQGFVVESLWVNPDSYALKMTPSTTASD